MSTTQDYPLEQIKEHIDNAHCNAHYESADQLYVIGQTLTALAMMKYNELSIPFPFVVSDGGIDIEVT
jgi:hypothetical protein